MSIKAPLYHSHRDDTKQGGTAPEQAHMALLTGRIGDPDALLAIPKGSHIFFISDPRRADGVQEWILEKVVYNGQVLKELRLVAYSRSTQSTRRMRLVANYEGDYRSGLEAEQGRMVKMLEEGSKE